MAPNSSGCYGNGGVEGEVEVSNSIIQKIELRVRLKAGATVVTKANIG